MPFHESAPRVERDRASRASNEVVDGDDDNIMVSRYGMNA